jgi:DNA-directed RNA polymerase subunit E'/Rpb7
MEIGQLPFLCHKRIRELGFQLSSKLFPKNTKSDETDGRFVRISPVLTKLKTREIPHQIICETKKELEFCTESWRNEKESKFNLNKTGKIPFQIISRNKKES